MSDRETDPRDAALDPPENTEENDMSLEPSDDRARALDPPEDTKQKPQ